MDLFGQKNPNNFKIPDLDRRTQVFTILASPVLWKFDFYCSMRKNYLVVYQG